MVPPTEERPSESVTSKRTFRLFLALGVCLVCLVGFAWRGHAIAGTEKFLDGRLYYDSKDVAALIEDICGPGTSGEGCKNLALYRTTELTLDMVFPLAYATLLAMLVLVLLRPNPPHWLIWAPCVAAVMDIGENSVIAAITAGYYQAGETGIPVWIASTLTIGKWVLVAVAVLGLLVTLIRRLEKQAPLATAPK